MTAAGAAGALNLGDELGLFTTFQGSSVAVAGIAIIIEEERVLRAIDARCPLGALAACDVYFGFLLTA